MIPVNQEQEHLLREDQAGEWEEVQARLPEEQQEKDMEMEPGDAPEETPGKNNSSG